MKFPGKRKQKHYFPVEPDQKRLITRSDSDDQYPALRKLFYVVGLDQPLVDIEVRADANLIQTYNIKPGESMLLDDGQANRLYEDIKQRNLITGEFAGGAVGNTLHNYTVLANSRAILLGSIHRNISVGDYAFTYLCQTSSLVDLNHLKPCDAPMGRAICFVFPNGERSFGISPGCMNQFDREAIPSGIIPQSSALLLTAFLLRDKKAPIYQATLDAIEQAQTQQIPVVMNMGTSFLIEEDPHFWQRFIDEQINVVAMNESESYALTGIQDPLLALQQTLEWTDLVLLTCGAKGLYIGGYCDQETLRATKDEVYSKSIAEYNRYEYSRAMLRKHCTVPVPIYTHINPYQGGPRRISTTNGAGDAALSAVLHDIAANHYHRSTVRNSPKHQAHFLTYSSVSQIARYANRVSYEVLIQNSPRLVYGLPEREDSLEETYWDA